MERNLTAILSADVEGYGRLMSKDEEATVRTLITYREAMGRLITKHRVPRSRFSRRQSSRGCYIANVV